MGARWAPNRLMGALGRPLGEFQKINTNWVPNGTQNGAENGKKMGPEPEPVPRGVPGGSWEPLGTILGVILHDFGCILGGIFDVSEYVFQRFSGQTEGQQTDRQTDSQADRQADRQTETDRQPARQTDRQTDTWTPDGVTHGRQKG